VPGDGTQNAVERTDAQRIVRRHGYALV